MTMKTHVILYLVVWVFGVFAINVEYHSVIGEILKVLGFFAFPVSLFILWGGIEEQGRREEKRSKQARDANSESERLNSLIHEEEPVGKILRSLVALTFVVNGIFLFATALNMWQYIDSFPSPSSYALYGHDIADLPPPLDPIDTIILRLVCAASLGIAGLFMIVACVVMYGTWWRSE